ncbi:MAG TPA: hypothetical protein VKS60_11420 [Stellaceae bacterium]|nr:hypothetical protein [Stellaceae bacterium]
MADHLDASAVRNASSDRAARKSDKLRSDLVLAGAMFVEAVDLDFEGAKAHARQYSILGMERLALAFADEPSEAALRAEGVVAAVRRCADILAECEHVPSVLRERIRGKLIKLAEHGDAALAVLLRAQCVGCTAVIKETKAPR